MENSHLLVVYLVRTAFIENQSLCSSVAAFAETKKCTNPVALGILLEVDILFIISIASFVVLLGAAFAILYHIRSSHRDRRPTPPPEPSFTEHLYAAAEYGTPRSSRLVSHQTIQSVTARKDSASGSESAGDPNSSRRSNLPRIVHRSPESSESHGQAHISPAHGAAPRPLRVVGGTRAASSQRF